MKSILAWLDARIGFSETMLPMLTHPIPRGAAGPMGWWYVFGSASITLLMIQILTGIALALVYVPSADQAYESLLYLNYEHPWGWFLRALHNASAGGMVLMVVIHMTQVFLHGAYKYPRELTWVLGVLLLLLTLGLAFTGQVLRWDGDAYWGIGVGAAMAGRVPWVGPWIVRLMLGGPIIGADTLSRFFALHVFVLPGLLFGTLALHLWLVLRRGISEPPQPGKLVDPATYDEEYEEELKRGVPFLGDAVIKDGLFSALVVIAVVTIAAVLGPKGPGAPPDPSLTSANPKPDWPFLWLYAMLTLLPAQIETPVILVLPVVLFGFLFAVPFISNRGERAPSRRPLAVLGVIVAWTLILALTFIGFRGPGAPTMDAWSGLPVPTRLVQGSTPLQLMGASVLQNKQCRNCHALDGVGGIRGPDLTNVGVRLNRDDLIRQVIQGGGDMPAYGKQLKPDEVTALVDFLVRCRPAKEPPARDPAMPPTE
ncbi:MAG: cytochrome b N-terminal domain-containing protein [Gemmataceae bacterium]